MPLRRGVYEEQVAPEGERWLTVVASSGKVGIVHLPAELVDAAFIESLWRKVDAGRTISPAPPPRLKLVI